MPTLLILMILGAAGFAFWNSARAAAERAEALGRNACHAAGVQLLDQTVHASAMRLRRGHDGRMGFERDFRFEYSRDGQDRQVGKLILRGERMIGFSGPLAQDAAHGPYGSH